jgi:hypothetical protein
MSDPCCTIFDQGIRFACLQCGKCCTGEPGTVYVAPDELRPLAAFLGLSVSTLIEECLYPFRDSFSIREEPGGDCLFYDRGCTVYPVRPSQCRTFPFWVKNLRSEFAWRQVCLECPGIGQGRLFSREEILDILERAVL